MQMDVRSHYIEMVKRTVAEIMGRLDDPPGYQELAAQACLSPYHFHRIFRALVGESPAELTRRLRLERAAADLRTTTKTVTEIAFDAGYATHEAFTKSFQTEFRTSPSGFRSGTQGSNGIDARCGLHYLNGGFTMFHLLSQGDMDMKIEVIDFPGTRVAAIRHVGPYHEIGQAFGQLGAKAGPMGLFARPNAFGVGIYYDDPDTVPAQELKADAGVFVAEDAQIGDLLEARLDAGRYLKGEFFGAYEGLGEAWSAFCGRLLAESGEQVREGICFEVYVNDCRDTPPDRLQTDLYLPIV